MLNSALTAGNLEEEETPIKKLSRGEICKSYPLLMVHVWFEVKWQKWANKTAMAAKRANFF